MISEHQGHQGSRHSGCFSYLKLVKLHLLGSEIMKPRAALLYGQLRGVQALLKRLGARLEIFHLSQKVLKHTKTVMKTFVLKDGG